MIFKRIFQMIVLVVAVLGVIGTLYFRAQYEAIKMNPNIEAQKQVADLVEQVGKLMVLPSNETPTVEVAGEKSIGLRLRVIVASKGKIRLLD